MPDFVREGVGADDGLVRLDRDAGVRADQAAGADDLSGVDVRAHAELLRPRMQRHHDLFEGGVARAFADAVDRHLDLPRAVLDRRQRVRGRQPQVVVAVGRDDHILRARHILSDAADQPAELARQGVARRIRDVQRGRAGLDRHLEHLVEEFGIGAARVLGRELDVGAQAAGVRHRLAGALQALLAADLELVRQVDVRGREEGVDARPFRLAHGVPGAIDVALAGARQPGDDRRVFELTHLARNPAHRLEIARRGDGEARLDHIDAQPRQLMGDLQLLVDVQRRARRLLAVAQRGVEDDDDITTVHIKRSFR